MRRPRVAINAAVLAAAIRIDALIETDIGRIVSADDVPRAFVRDVRFDRRCGFIVRRPAVVEDFAALRFETSFAVRRRAATFDGADFVER